PLRGNSSGGAPEPGPERRASTETACAGRAPGPRCRAGTCRCAAPVRCRKGPTRDVPAADVVQAPRSSLSSSFAGEPVVDSGQLAGPTVNGWPLWNYCAKLYHTFCSKETGLVL